ncbi:MAG: substrate-binding domain-containing protein [Planctomycetes bacterium]|nr:substrate-binding domain-containing protein [Planctomycetota bacterium]
MRSLSRRALIASFVAVALAACGGDASQPSGRLRVAVIPKGTTHEFWKAVETGAKRAGEELGVEVVWKGPLKENDRAEQIRVVEQFASEGVDGIALAPLDDKALVRPVADARTKGIDVVIFDSALEGTAGTDFASFVASDNLEGGRMAGREMARLLDGRGKVVVLRYQVGSASTIDRESGFLEVIGRQPGLELLSADQYAGASVESAKTKALNLLDVLRQADGIFCSNESASVGMLRALEQEGLAGKVKFVGFDATPPLVEALASGAISALVVQDPVDMGHRAVQTLVAAVQGRPVEPRIATTLALATKANLSEPSIARLLK